MTSATLKHMEGMLPWDDLPSDRQRKQRITILMLLLAFLLSVSIPFIKVPKQSRAEAEAVPERIARVVQRKVELPPPPPPPKPKEEPKPEDKPKVEEKVEQKIETRTEAKPVEVVKAREKAAQMLKDSGIEDLQSMAAEFDLPQPSGGLITGGAAEAGTSRSVLTSRAGSGSGSSVGSYAGSMSAGTGGKAAGKGSAAALGAGGTKLQSVQSGINAAAQQQAAARVGKDGKSRRSTEDIAKGIDRYKARLDNLYQRALRDDPTMQGTVVMKITVEPDGSVSAASISSSELNNDELEQKMVSMVRGFNFGAMNVEPWTGPISVNFYPR
jgi:TonB family protein